MADFLAKIGLDKLERALIYGVVIAIVLALLKRAPVDYNWFAFFFRWLHVLSGVMWIGLLWYFNFVQIPSMPKIPDEQKPAIGKVIAPTALFYFRWAAAGTVLFGAITAAMNMYLVEALTFQADYRTIGLGMWLALIMAANVWFVIWPNQKKVLGLVEADADSKKKAARVAMLASRTNTLLSIAMLYCMVAYQNVG